MAQGTVYKSVFKNAAYIFFIKLFPAFAGIIVLILYSRNLSQEDYGIYQDFWVKLLLIGTLVYAGLPVTIITYPADVVKGFIKKITTKHLLLYAMWALLWAAAFCYFFRNAAIGIWLLVPFLLLYAIHAVQEAMLMASQKMKGLLAVNFLYAVYFLFLHIHFLKNYSLHLLILGLMIGSIVRAIILLSLTIIVYRKVAAVSAQDQQLSKARSLWLHLGFYDLIQTLFRYADKFILASFLSASVFAVYFNGAQSAEVPLLPYLLGAVASSLLLQLSDKKNNPYQSYKLLRDSGKLLSCIVFPLFFFLWFFAHEIFDVVFTEKYKDSVPVFLMAILVLPLRSYSYTTMLQHLHKGAIINKGAVLDLLLALGLMYPFYQIFGLPGVPLSFVISTYIQVVYYLWHTSRFINVPLLQLLPLKDWVLKLVVYGSLIGSMHFFLHAQAGDYSLMVGAAFTLLIVLVSIKLTTKTWMKR
ncbi:MAG TPA: oligosaccharide flippase family protein [Flavipsychrobacter sp.]|nr:oligosaccharide flippase family protein [Flavipsychrobacter sp.]